MDNNKLMSLIKEQYISAHLPHMYEAYYLFSLTEFVCKRCCIAIARSLGSKYPKAQDLHLYGYLVKLGSFKTCTKCQRVLKYKLTISYSILLQELLDIESLIDKDSSEFKIRVNRLLSASYSLSTRNYKMTSIDFVRRIGSLVSKDIPWDLII